jgi:hypothetical protein
MLGRTKTDRSHKKGRKQPNISLNPLTNLNPKIQLEFKEFKGLGNLYKTKNPKP